MNAYLKKEKAYWDLKPSERKRLDEACFRRYDEELIKAQFIWIKMGCCACADNGCSEGDILSWLANFKRIYQINSRLQSQEQLNEFLDKKLATVFGEGGFPEQFMLDFEKIGNKK